MRGLTGGLGGYRSRDGGLSWEPVHGQGAPTHFGSVIVSLKVRVSCLCVCAS